MNRKEDLHELQNVSALSLTLTPGISSLTFLATPLRVPQLPAPITTTSILPGEWCEQLEDR